MKWLPPRAVRTPVKNADKDAARPSGHLGMREPLTWGRAGRYGLLIALVLAIAYPTAILVYLAFWSGQPGGPGHLTLQWFLEAFGGAAFDRVAINTLVFAAVKCAFAAVIGGGLAFLQRVGCV